MRWRLGLASFALATLVVCPGCATSGLSAPEIRLALSGASEFPPNASTASGRGSFWIHPDRTLNGVLEVSGMSDSAANLYLGGAGEVGPQIIRLVRTGSDGPVGLESAPVTGASWSAPRGSRLSEEDYQAYLEGRIYVNVHSERYPDGEIRAQLKP